MNERLQSIIDYTKDASFNFNKGNHEYPGLLFKRKETGVSMLAISKWFIAEMENTGIEPETEFYSLHYGKWVNQHPFPWSTDYMISAFDRFEIMGKFTLRLNNVLNHIMQLDNFTECNDVKEESRIIISRYQPEENRQIISFKDIGGILQYKIDILPKPFVISNNSAIPPQYIKPDTKYVCEVIEEREDAYIVSCLEPYGIIRLGLKHSPKGFIPSDMDGINRLKGIPFNLIHCTDLLEPRDIDFQPIHLNCLMFFHLAKMFTILNTEFIDVYFGPDPGKIDRVTGKKQLAIVMHNVKKSKDEPTIRIAMQSLNQDYGPQRS